LFQWAFENTVVSTFLKKLIFILYFRSFWCVNLKNNFKKIKKNIILMYFNIKNILKNNRNQTSKHIHMVIMIKHYKLLMPSRIYLNPVQNRHHRLSFMNSFYLHIHLHVLQKKLSVFYICLRWNRTSIGGLPALSYNSF
jgi:hypothetical protein